MTTDPLRVALHTGVLLRHDAISTSLLRKLRLLRRLAADGQPVRVAALVAHTDVDEPGIDVVERSWDRITALSFRDADVHIWEYGIWYPGFDTVFAASPGTAQMAVYHNITPPDEAADAETAEVLQRSLVKRHILSVMHHVVCVSAFNQADLLDIGLDPGRMSVLPLPPGQPPRPDLRRLRLAGAPVRLLFVGRLTPAKGVRELVEAAAVCAAGAQRFTLDLVCNLRCSDPATIAWVRERIVRADLGGIVRFVGQLEDDELAAAYAAADALVLPSHHEGFGVPVIEALAAGCTVVTTSAGNLPEVGGGLGWVVPVGDIAALAAALAEVVHRFSAGQAVRLPSPAGDLPWDLWTSAVDRHLERFSEPAYERGFLRAVGAALGGAGLAVPSWLVEAAA